MKKTIIAALFSVLLLSFFAISCSSNYPQSWYLEDHYHFQLNADGTAVRDDGIRGHWEKAGWLDSNALEITWVNGYYIYLNTSSHQAYGDDDDYLAHADGYRCYPHIASVQ